MPIVDLTPEKMEEIADRMEDHAYVLPPGQKRTDLLIQVYSLRRAANRAKWDDEFVVKAEVREMPVGGVKRISEGRSLTAKDFRLKKYSKKV